MVRLEMEIKVDFNEAQISQEVIGKAKKALLELMFAIERHAKRFAPVRTGRLRASIHTEPTRPAETILVADGVEYGVHQEFGTVYMRAHPFLRPARDVALKVDLAKILAKHGLS